jgi:hypothetical protein
MKRRSITALGEVEHRGVRKLLNFLPDATDHDVDVERSLGRVECQTHLKLNSAKKRPELTGADMNTIGFESQGAP